MMEKHLGMNTMVGEVENTESMAGEQSLLPMEATQNRALDEIYSMAHEQYTNGFYNAAGQAFQYLCLHDQGNPRYFLCLGACQQMLMIYGQAIETYLYSYELNPDNPLAMIYAADCYQMLGKVEESIEAYELAIGIPSNDKSHTHEINRAQLRLSALKNRGNL